MDFVINCDLKCLKEILNRQAGGPTHGCFCCDAVTNLFQKRDRVRGTDFTNELILAKSTEWKAKWQREGGGCTAKEFESSAAGKSWSLSNMSFAGVYSLVDVGIEQYMVDYLHLTLRIVPFLFTPIVAEVSKLQIN